jgi:hypothetical protein
MSDASTTKMIEAYIEREARPTGFFAGFFQSPRRNFYNSDKISIDIQRNSEDIATPKPSITVRGKMNEVTKYTNKEFEPPVYTEETQISSYELSKRRPGQNPFDDVEYMSRAFEEMRRGMGRLEDKIRRALELQAAQCLQTGAMTLVDPDSGYTYTITFSPKATHFPTAGVVWSNGSADPLADLRSLGDVINVDGKSKPEVLVFGKGAINTFLGNSDVRDLLDNRRIERGNIGHPMIRGNGGVYHGEISTGQYRFEVWTYEGYYKHPDTGLTTYYMDADKVCVIAPGRRDLAFASVPGPIVTDPRVSALSLGRVSNAEGGMDLHTNVWVEPNGMSIHGEIKSRPLCIPTAIDTFGCLTTE